MHNLWHISLCKRCRLNEYIPVVLVNQLQEGVLGIGLFKIKMLDFFPIDLKVFLKLHFKKLSFST